MRIIGYDMFLDLLKATYLLRLVGVPSAHVLVVSPPGTAKTTMAKLFAKAVGAKFVRTTGRHDMLPEDFIAEKVLDYVNGRPVVKWELRAVGKLLAENNRVPAIWFFDEFDKMSRKSLTALLELMEEQQVTLPGGEKYDLNFMLVAAGNTRKYDRDANPVPRSVRDRFTVYWELGYLGVDKEVEVLDQAIKYLLGVDTQPSPQFSFSPDHGLFSRYLDKVKDQYGPCIVKAVAYLRKHREVEEPPGPRAYIHAVLLASALATVRGILSGDVVMTAFKAATAGKISVSDGDAFEVCEEAFTRHCLEKNREEKRASREFFRWAERRHPGKSVVSEIHAVR